MASTDFNKAINYFLCKRPDGIMMNHEKIAKHKGFNVKGTCKKHGNLEC